MKDKPADYWEHTTHALLVLLISKKVLVVDQLRRAVESLHPEHYIHWSYYEKWAAAMMQLTLESKTISEHDMALAMGGEESYTGKEGPRFEVGQRVVVKEELLSSRFRKPHLRVQGYLFGAAGIVERHCGAFSDPEFLAWTGNSESVPKQNLYRIRFAHSARGTRRC